MERGSKGVCVCVCVCVRRRMREREEGMYVKMYTIYTWQQHTITLIKL